MGSKNNKLRGIVFILKINVRTRTLLSVFWALLHFHTHIFVDDSGVRLHAD